MPKEELNQELSTDELKDVAGGSWTVEGNLCKTTGEGSPENFRKIDLKTGDLLGKKGRKGKNPSVIFPGNDGFDINNDQK